MTTDDTFSKFIEKANADTRANRLRSLYSEHVIHPEGDKNWKQGAYAVVDAEIADDVEEAMGFIGSIVDERQEDNGRVYLRSDGYYHHIGA